MVNKVSINLPLVLRDALKAVQLGRDVLLHYFGNLSQIEHKYQAGLVSEADRESEQVIREYLNSKHPTFEFSGEESYAAGESLSWSADHAEARWILDPLDGTSNYIHRFPVFCISLGLEINGEIVLSVIDVPILKETYTAIKGQGAFMNGRRLSVSQENTLKNSFLSTGFFSEIEENLKEQLAVFDRIVRLCSGVRRPGAAAYDLCLVASGVFDGYWEKNLKPWDSAAGILLVREAGGIVKTYHGLEYNPYHNSIVAGNETIVNQLIQNLKLCPLLATTH